MLVFSSQVSFQCQKWPISKQLSQRESLSIYCSNRMNTGNFKEQLFKKKYLKCSANHMDMKYGVHRNTIHLNKYCFIRAKDVYVCTSQKKTTNAAVIGDCGRFPIYILSIKKVLKY